MAMHNAFHSRNDINKFYLWREKGGKRSEDHVDLAIKRLTDYTRKSKDRTFMTETATNTKQILEWKTWKPKIENLRDKEKEW